MAKMNGHEQFRPSQRGYRWVTLMVALAFIFSVAWVQPVSAGSSTVIMGDEIPASPANPLQTLSVRTYNIPLPQSENGAVYEPPVPNQGGTCIDGYVIDSYHVKFESGWTILVTTPSGAVLNQQLADFNFKFGDLPAGTYLVELKMNDGYRPFTPTKFPVTLSGVGDDCASVRFKVETLPCLEVIKVDANGGEDGVQLGLPDWEFTVTNGNTSLKQTTDGVGRTIFKNLTPGTWKVTETMKEGWMPASGQTTERQVELYPPENPDQCICILFVNQQVHDAAIIVEKYDVAGNPVSDWEVNLTRDDGTQPPQQGFTNSAGQVVFNGLALGKWTVTEEVPHQWRPVGPTSQGVVLERPGYAVVVKFINEPLSCIDGYKINHLDQGLPNWVINAVNTETGQEAQTVTDANGYFIFDTLSLGTWVLSEELQEGWEPVTSPKFEVQITEPFKCTTVRFKNRTNYACIDIWKKDQIDGAGLPGWQFTVTPAYGGESIIGITDGTGYVRFNGLTPGDYIVEEAVAPGWTAVSDPVVHLDDLEATGLCTELEFINIQTHMIDEDKNYPDEPKKPKKDSSCPLWYTVKRGDTVWAIGQRYDVPASAIARVNHLKNPSLIHTGQTLCIPLGDP